MLEEYFSTPKRSAIRVLARLMDEFPELRPEFAKLRRELVGLGRNRTYRTSLYCWENVPNTFRRFNAWPEFQPLRAALPGYIPEANP
jgi:hypothetical protein